VAKHQPRNESTKRGGISILGTDDGGTGCVEPKPIIRMPYVTELRKHTPVSHICDASCTPIMGIAHLCRVEDFRIFRLFGRFVFMIMGIGNHSLQERRHGPPNFLLACCSMFWDPDQSVMPKGHTIKRPANRSQRLSQRGSVESAYQ
jgi:hypothetical protein